MTSVATELLVCGSAPALSGLLERGSFQVRATAGPRLLVPPPRYRTLGRVATEVVFFSLLYQQYDRRIEYKRTGFLPTPP